MRAPEPIVIIGAGGHGREVLDIIEAINTVEPRWALLGFVDDGDPPIDRLHQRGAPLLGGDEVLAGLDARYVVGIGSPVARRSVAERCDVVGLDAARLVHPQASIGSVNAFGPGLVVAAHAAVTTNVVLGRHVHLNLGATVSHDCVLGDFVTVNPGANVSGSVVLEDGVTIGTGAAVIQGRRVGARTMVGAGAVVTADLPRDAVAVGVPARVR